MRWKKKRRFGVGFETGGSIILERVGWGEDEWAWSGVLGHGVIRVSELGWCGLFWCWV